MQDAARTIRCGTQRRDDRRCRRLGRLPAALGLVAVLRVCALAAGPATQPAAELSQGREITVRLHGVAVVDGEQVTLGDIAEIRGDTAGLAASCPVVLSPKPGRSLVLPLEAVQKALSDRGANLGHWTFRGSSRCTVSRPIRRNDDENRVTGRPADGSELTTAQPPAANRTASPAAVDTDSLAGALRQYIRRRLADLGGEPVIEFPKAASQQLSLSRPTYDFRIAARGEPVLGLIPLDVTVTDLSRQEQTFQILAHVALRKPVAVAARPLNRGKVIEAADVVMQEQVFERAEDVGLSSPTPLIGQQTRRFIDKGEQLRTKDFEPLPLVQRNDLVTVLITRGSLRVRGTARALGAGAFGEVIEVRNEMAERSGGRFSAVVVGEKTVEVPETRRPTATAPAEEG